MKREPDNASGRLIFLLIFLCFILLVLGSSDDDGPEWSGVSHVDGRN